MIALLKKTFQWILFKTRAVYLLRRAYKKMFHNPVRILYSHRVIDKTDKHFTFLRELQYQTREEFEDRIKFLLKHYRFIPLDRALEYLGSATRLPDCLVLTFDDGYESVYTKIYPVLKKYRVPAAIFLTVDFIETDVTPWYDHLAALIYDTSVKRFYIPQLAEREFDISTLDGQKEAYAKICLKLKQVDEAGKNELLAELDRTLKYIPDAQPDMRLMLTWEQINEMSASGLITFGSHTMTHSILTRIPVDKLEKEILGSKKILEGKLGLSINAFSYPNGGYGDYNDTTKKVIEDSGYTCALLTTAKNNTDKSDFFELGRDGLIREPLYRFIFKLSGCQCLAAALKDKLKL